MGKTPRQKGVQVTTFTEFLWLCHYGLTGFYVLVCAAWLYVRIIYRHDYEAAYEMSEGRPSSFTDEAAQGFGLLIGGHLVPYSLAMEAVAVWLLVLMTAAAILGTKLDRVKPYMDAIAKWRAKPSTADDSETFFHDVGDDETGDFSYRADAFGGGSGKAESNSKRHPDDARFWAFVDDPNASPNERIKAMEEIAKREAKRANKGKRGTGRNLVKRAS